MVKYTGEILRAAVASSLSMAGVLRHLGVPYSGGTHAHLRRRIAALGIDTSHFLGRAHRRGQPSARRLDATAILVLRDPHDRRARPELLRRALAEIGRDWKCDECGIGSTWHGRRLTLQVDHRNGRAWDSRPENLRLLCPNCHSQTPTYAGRNRRRFGGPADPADGRSTGDGSTASTAGVAPDRSSGTREGPLPVSDEAIAAAIARVDRRELTVTEAARLIGCHRNHFYRLRRRLTESGSLRPCPGGRRWRATAERDRVIAYALAHPELGPKSLARRLAEHGQPGNRAVSHGTVSNILREAGLNTAAARRSRLIPPAGVV